MTEFDQALSELEMAVTASDPDTLASAIVMLSGMFIFFAVVAVIWYFVSAIGYAKMFKKAGESGWKAYIPYYNDFIRFKISWNTKSFWIYLISLVVMQLSGYFEGTAAEVVFIISGIVFIVYSVKMCLKLAKSFGKGNGTGVLLLFFPFIVSLVLGCGKAQYVGEGGAVSEQ